MSGPADLLRAIGGMLRVRVAHYRGSKRIAEAAVPFADSIRIALNEKSWRLSGTLETSESHIQRLDLAVTFEGIHSPPFAFGFEIELGDWSLENLVVLPAAAYRGNRFVAKPLEYPCILIDPEDFRPDVPNTISEVPRLELGEGPSRIQLRSGDLSTPAIGIYFPARQMGLWVLTAQGTELGPNGIEIEESSDRRRAWLRFMAPGVREDTRYGGGPKWVPSEDRGGRLKSGETGHLSVWIDRFPAESTAAFFDRFLALRKLPSMPGPESFELPWSAAWERLERKYNAVNWDEERGYYACGDRQSRYAQWQIGWVGGMISSHALMAEGAPRSKERAARNMDFAATTGQAPSGLYWSVGIDGEMFSDMVDMDWGEDWHLVRRSGDALYFMLRQIALREREQPAPASWRESCRRCADALLQIWRRNGQFGQFVSEIDGTIRVGGTASGAIVPAALALAAQAFEHPPFLDAAREAARHLNREFLERGFTSGGPGEAAQCPDSESAFALLESMMTLHDVTGEAEWRELAGAAAAHAATWVMSYDFAFPPASSFGRLGMRTAGSVWANAQNKHSAPGICTLSGVALFKLFRATGKPVYLELLRDIARGITQYLSRKDRPVFNMPEGYMCERVNTSDWESPYIPPGEGFHGGCWCEVSAMLTWVEVPGLYVQTDTGFVLALDHVEVIRSEVSEHGLIVSIRNPTKFDLSLKPFVERASDCSNPLPPDFLAGVPARSIGAGQTVEFRF